MAEPSASVLDLLRRVPYFAGLSDEVLAALAQAAGARRYGRGQIIFLEGDPCAGLFIVGSGEVKIFSFRPKAANRSYSSWGRAAPSTRLQCWTAARTRPA